MGRKLVGELGPNLTQCDRG